MEQMGDDFSAPAHPAEDSFRPHDSAQEVPLRRPVIEKGLLSSWLALGLFWLPVGMAVTPGSQPRSLYHWTLALTLFLPGLVVLCRRRGELARRWLTSPPLQLCLLLLAWASVTLFWATGPQLVERLKAPIFVVLYISAWLAWSRQRSRGQVQSLLWWIAIALSMAALVAMIAFPWRHIVWHHRMIGLALLDGPNLSAYVMACAFLWLTQLVPPAGLRRHLGWAAMLVLLVFVGWTGSRGSWVALFACLVGMMLWRRDRLSRGLAWGAVAVVLLVLVLMPSELMHRGLSYRPQIFRQAVAFIEARPWTGLGLGSDYRVIAGPQVLTHSHNIFTNVAIEIGLPGLLLWALLWVSMGWQGWRHRGQPLGAIVLVTWIFASVALQVDGPSFLQSPRPEWLVTWLPLAIALQLWLAADGKGGWRGGEDAGLVGRPTVAAMPRID